jgi:hypothetical protein
VSLTRKRTHAVLTVRAQLDTPARRRELDGIAQQVLQHLQRTRAVRRHGGQPACGFALEHLAALLAQVADHLDHFR